MGIVVKTFCWILLLLTVRVTAAQQPLTMADVSHEREILAKTKNLSDTERSEVSSLYDQVAQLIQQELRLKAQQVGHARRMAMITSELTAAQAAVATPLPVPAAA